MNAVIPLRLVPAFAGALGITLGIFLFMQGLIQRGQDDRVELAVFEHVEILRPTPEQREPEKPPEAAEDTPQEPVMKALQAAPPVPSPQPRPELEMPALDLAMADIKVPAAGERFRAPLGAGGVTIPGGGQDAQGFVEVVPYNTRKPNVPEVAWQNKISGWVLVAFSVTPGGSTRNVRVLDARPRGVFEEKVIAAVEDWRYSINFSGQSAQDVVLTQRIDVRWQDYPSNMPNVD